MKEYDSSFYEIQKAFFENEIAEYGLADGKLRGMVGLVCLTSIQTLQEIPEKVQACIAAGVSVTEIKEAMYQAAPYIGYPRVSAALAVVNETLCALGIEPQGEDMSETTADTRFEKGLAVQISIFGDQIRRMRESAPAETKHIQDCLSANCFGDYYTRGYLDLKVRELLTFTAIISIGGCDPQAKAHAAGNLSVGNTKKLLIETVTTCLPYIGYPRTLNALTCIEEVCK